MDELLGWHVFTERARKAVYLANYVASLHGETTVTTVHLLLGVIGDDDNVARRVLSMIGITPERVSIDLRKSLKRPRRSGKIPSIMLSDDAVHAIELAYEEAHLLSNTYVGTEHMLLGLIREGHGIIGKVCSKFNIQLERVRKIIRSLQYT
ncbi:MAG TPA: Clp protease N-terminal domain-containing protein [Chthonomonadaceae bacterium]|nr:Clp protease N-terminal domain-containing protein [Chthonomonadaceae bacterium]